MNESNLSDDALAELLTLTMEVDEYGETRYLNHLGQSHRMHGPAIICADGSKLWFQNDKRHRIDGPAVILSNGVRYWYQNGEIHRTDGPAIEWSDGGRSWHIHGERLTEKEWNERTRTV